MAVDPATWLLSGSPAKDGKPWGTGTKMASRAISSSTPWDVGCKVTPIIGGYAALSAMRDALEQLIEDAQASTDPPGQKGHVYIADWRFNCQRDLSDANSWITGSWAGKTTSFKDQTAIGLVLRLMQCGVAVRILVWLPNTAARRAAQLGAHVKDHIYLWNVVKHENDALQAVLKPSIPLGVVGLDRRTADGAVAGAHHQKMMVIRSPNINLAFCGGVDLAFSRRDAPTNPQSYTAGTVQNGDWQSGTTMPAVTPIGAGIIWPGDSSTVYDRAIKCKPWDTSSLQSSDLPTNTNTPDVCLAAGGTWDGTNCTYKTADGNAGSNLPIYGDSNQYWHDQHLKLEGQIVSTIEWQFWERWIDFPLMSPRVINAIGIALNSDPLRFIMPEFGAVCFSTDTALTKENNVYTAGSVVVPLDPPQDISQSVGNSAVQMWRTIPMRERTADLFKDGEFSIMSGISKAMKTATELIWIFDQYFWSEPVGRLLNYQVQNNSGLCVLVILPPHADSTYPEEHRARQLALQELTLGLSADQLARVAVYNMWHPQGKGIYVHAKAHTYDGALMVCGSANMNRRSLTCDSELACAVVDADVVAAHQQNLWNVLFGNAGSWPGLDLNQGGNGVKFLNAFKAAASASGIYVVPDPWYNDNPMNPTPSVVALPNGVKRTPAVLGPKYETMSAIALDPGSLDPTVENDVVLPGNATRPARLDDIVGNVEYYTSSTPPRYPRRLPASLVREQLIHMAGTLYSAGGYQYTECAWWWKQFCAALPCFKQIGWPGYETAIIDNVTIDGQSVVLQLWRGWCQRFGGMLGMPGGIGAEVGVYRRIPDQFQKFVEQFGNKDFLTKKLGSVPAAYFTTEFFQLTDDLVWWPYPELNATLTFSLTNPVTNQEFFSAGPENSYWMCKWMTPDDYDNKYKPANSAPDKLSSWDFILNYTVAGKTNSYSATWDKSTGMTTFPPR
jgi:hypothetical protein